MSHSSGRISQMKPEEMRPDEWDIFYPLAYWDIIAQESRARSLDPYQVAGLIRQESVFNPRAVSPARAYGLMQVVVPTGILTAKKVGHCSGGSLVGNVRDVHAEMELEEFRRKTWL